MTDLLNRGGELQAKLNDLVLGGGEVTDSCQRRPSDGQSEENRRRRVRKTGGVAGGGRQEEKRKNMGRQQKQRRRDGGGGGTKNGDTFVGVFPQYSSARSA